MTDRNDSQTLSIGSLLGILRRRKVLFLGIAFPLLVLFAAAAFVLPPTYEAEALLAAEPAVALDGEAPAPDVDVQRSLATISDVLLRRSRIEQMADELGLGPDASGPLTEEEVAAIRSRIRIRAEGPRTFTIGFEDDQRDRVARAVSWLAETLIASSRAERENRAEATAGFLEEQIRPVRTRLDELEREMTGYKGRHAAEIPEQVPTSLKLLETTQAQLQETTEALDEDRARRAAIQRELLELERQGVSPEPPRHPAERRLETLRADLQDLRRRYTDKHPAVIRAVAEVEELETAIADGTVGPAPTADVPPLQLRYLQLEAELDAVDSRLEQRRRERAALLSERTRYQSRVAAAPRHETALAAMEREYDSTRVRYEDLREQLHEARMAERLEKTDQGAVFRMVEPPRAPAAPASPHRLRLLVMGLAAALGLGFGTVLVAEQVDTTFREPTDVESELDLPVLATVPAATAKRRGRKDAADGHVPVLDDPRGPLAEQYRILATRLTQRAAAERPGSFVVTSPVGGEGKTTTAVNLALSLARMVEGEVLLIDADFGRPAAHRFLRVPEQRGLTDLLARPDDDPDAYVHAHHGLALLQAGVTPAGEHASLASAHGRRVIQHLRQRFRYVIVDAPPVLAVAEGLILQREVDSTLLVVRARRTPRDVVRQAVKSLDRSRLAGVILNDADPTAAYAYMGPYHYAARDRGRAAAEGGRGR